MADQKLICVCNSFEEIDEFHSIWEFQRFQKYIEEFVKNGGLVEIPVKKAYAGFSEKWYKCQDCQQTWRLVYPDFPFRGLWQRVK